MENALYIGLSKQMAMRQHMNLVANNIANVNTPGYRAEKMLFEEFIVDPKPANEDISMVLDFGQYKDTRQGNISFTGKTLDVALEGPAFFMVETSQGTQYTRAGNFTLNNERELVTASGEPVLDNGQGRIVFPEGARDIVIAHDGQIVTDQGAVGQIGMMEFANVNNLRATGSGYFLAENGEQPLPAEQTRMKQNMLEGSNVQAVLEMTDMIEIARDYQSMQRMLQNEHDRQRDTIRKLTE